MAALAGFGALLYLALEIATYLWPDEVNATAGFTLRAGEGPLTDAIPFAYRAGALAFDLIPTALIVWALIELRRLFLFYAQGQVFGADALKALQRVAQLMFIEVIVAILVGAPISYLL